MGAMAAWMPLGAPPMPRWEAGAAPPTPRPQSPFLAQCFNQVVACLNAVLADIEDTLGSSRDHDSDGGTEGRREVGAAQLEVVQDHARNEGLDGDVERIQERDKGWDGARGEVGGNHGDVRCGRNWDAEAGRSNDQAKSRDRDRHTHRHRDRDRDQGKRRGLESEENGRRADSNDHLLALAMAFNHLSICPRCLRSYSTLLVQERAV